MALLGGLGIEVYENLEDSAVESFADKASAMPNQMKHSVVIAMNDV
jgi:hypothetical protein